MQTNFKQNIAKITAFNLIATAINRASRDWGLDL